MARTKASVGAKVASVKSSKARCSAAPPPTSSSSAGRTERSSLGSSGGNPVCPRETPVWQKPITNFFCSWNDRKDDRGSDNEDDVVPGPSKAKPKRNMLESDEDEEKPKNTDLNESNIELEPLNAECSHKIVEYYGNNGVYEEKDDNDGGKDSDNSVDVEKNGENGIKDRGNGDISEEESGDSAGADIDKEIDTSKEVNGNTEDSKGKGKGRGKKTKKENLDNNGNIDRRKSVKRDLEEITFGEESVHDNKKVRVA